MTINTKNKINNQKTQNRQIHLQDQKTLKTFCSLSQPEIPQAYFKQSYIKALAENQKNDNDICLDCLNNLRNNNIQHIIKSLKYKSHNHEKQIFLSQFGFNWIIEDQDNYFISEQFNLKITLYDVIGLSGYPTHEIEFL